jgi:bacillopeptidase F (M6 metalloprotease family)
VWTTASDTPDSPPNAAFIPDQDGVSDKTLETPSLIINSATAQVTFRNYYDTERDADGAWDGGVLEVSINGGAFADITSAAIGGSFVTGGYDGTIRLDAMNPLAGRMAWSGNSGGYITTTANLGPNVNGQTIKLRFRMGTDAFVDAPGWRIDNFTVSNATCAP